MATGVGAEIVPCLSPSRSARCSSGLKTVVLERREIVGGCCVTEEFAPGYRASSGAYVLSMLRDAIWKDMRLVERGVVVDPAGPSLNLFADGTRLELSDDDPVLVELAHLELEDLLHDKERIRMGERAIHQRTGHRRRPA